MESIFKDAYFGKPYKAKNGTKMLLMSLYENSAYLYYENPLSKGHFGNYLNQYRLNGICMDKASDDFDIIGEWNESTDRN